ncbi:MAG TPA: MgtC/SapB family protein [Cyclobacteriaceae bacterium]|nr:MgtC/SapB family protein [Cyclobacteriaceae bacterium]
MMMNLLEQTNIFIDIIVASVLSGIIGIEREHQDKPAGIRTNIIIGGFSCLMISIISPVMIFLNTLSGENLSVDPLRIINALILGVSFVGGGTIIKISERQQVKGLTTAATLLYSSGIGICVALHLYILAIGLTLLTILINHLLPRIIKGPKQE